MVHEPHLSPIGLSEVVRLIDASDAGPSRLLSTMDVMSSKRLSLYPPIQKVGLPLAAGIDRQKGKFNDLVDDYIE